MNKCSICNEQEKSKYSKSKDVDIICSSCVQVFLAMPGDDLKRAYEIAEKKNPTQAGLIKTFVVKG